MIETLKLKTRDRKSCFFLEWLETRWPIACSNEAEKSDFSKEWLETILLNDDTKYLVWWANNRDTDAKKARPNNHVFY